MLIGFQPRNRAEQGMLDKNDLSPLIEFLPISSKLKNILRFLNKEANEAKHDKTFRSRM